MAHMYTELQMIKEALQKYQNLIEAGFSKSSYIISQIAVAYHNIRGLFSTLLCLMKDCSRGTYCSRTIFISDIDQALALFNELREQDPYRIDNMDTFSNLLYVKVSSPLGMCQSGVGGLNENESVESEMLKIFSDVLLMTLNASSEYEARVELLGPQPGGDRQVQSGDVLRYR